MFRKFFRNLTVVTAIIAGVAACSVLSADPKPKEIKGISLAMVSAQSSVDTLTIVAQWQAATVGNPMGPVTYPVRWSKNGVLVKSDTTAALADTVRVSRALLGAADTVEFSVRALYTANGRLSNEAVAVRFFANPDLQFPSVPVIIRVDTLP